MSIRHPSLPSSKYVEIAKRHGAKLDRADNGMWRILDQPNSLLWWTWFMDEPTACFVYCVQHGLAE